MNETKLILTSISLQNEVKYLLDYYPTLDNYNRLQKLINAWTEAFYDKEVSHG